MPCHLGILNPVRVMGKVSSGTTALASGLAPPLGATAGPEAHCSANETPQVSRKAGSPSGCVPSYRFCSWQRNGVAGSSFLSFFPSPANTPQLDDDRHSQQLSPRVTGTAVALAGQGAGHRDYPEASESRHRALCLNLPFRSRAWPAGRSRPSLMQRKLVSPVVPQATATAGQLCVLSSRVWF